MAGLLAQASTFLSPSQLPSGFDKNSSHTAAGPRGICTHFPFNQNALASQTILIHIKLTLFYQISSNVSIGDLSRSRLYRALYHKFCQAAPFILALCHLGHKFFFLGLA